MAVSDYKRTQNESKQRLQDSKDILKLIRVKESLRSLFKQLSLVNEKDLAVSITEELCEALKELGDPFCSFAPLVITQEFKNWFLSFKQHLTNTETETKAIIDKISFIFQLAETFSDKPLFPKLNLFPKPRDLILPSKEQQKLFIETAQLERVIKEKFDEYIKNPLDYEKKIITEVDKFFEPLDWALLKAIMYFLKITVSDYYHVIKDLKYIDQTGDKSNLISRNILKSYSITEAVIRQIRNVLAHPREKDTRQHLGTWDRVFAKLKDELKLKNTEITISKSEIGKTIFSKPIANYEKRVLRDTLTYQCLVKIVNIVEDWINNITVVVEQKFV